MTSPARDSVFIFDRAWVLLGMKGTPYFSPDEVYGLPLGLGASTSDWWRGFQVFYRVVDDALLISGLAAACVGSEIPTIHGIPRTRSSLDGSVWEGLSDPWPFTGVLIIGDEHDGRRQHAYPVLAGDYKAVLELQLEEGRLVSTIDRSGVVEALRGVNTRARAAIVDATREEYSARREQARMDELAKLPSETAAFSARLEAFSSNDYAFGRRW